MLSFHNSLISFLSNSKTLAGSKIRRIPAAEMDYGMGKHWQTLANKVKFPLDISCHFI